MADTLTPEQRRLNMSSIRSRDTAPELTVRRALHGRGFRFRLHRRDLPGRPDIVLPRYRTAVFVHGCFWHGHDCPLFKVPASRTEFWTAKVEANRRRDEASLLRLDQLGWRIACVWECALKGPGRLTMTEVSDRLATFILSADKATDIAGDVSPDRQRPKTVAR